MEAPLPDFALLNPGYQKRKRLRPKQPELLHASRNVLVREAATATGSKVEAGGTRALKPLIREAALALGPEMPADRTSAANGHRMTETARSTPPAGAAALSSLCGTCEGEDAKGERCA